MVPSMVRMEKHPWKGLKLLDQATQDMVGDWTVRMEKHPWKGLKHIVLSSFPTPSICMSEWKNIPGRVWNTGDPPWCSSLGSRCQNGKTSLEGFETFFYYIYAAIIELRQNGKTSLEGFETFQKWHSTSSLILRQNGKTSLEGFETWSKTNSHLTGRRESEWKNIPGRVWNISYPNSSLDFRMSQNGKTSLEGFETVICELLICPPLIGRSEWKNIPGRVWNLLSLLYNQK